MIPILLMPLMLLMLLTPLILLMLLTPLITLEKALNALHFINKTSRILMVLSVAVAFILSIVCGLGILPSILLMIGVL